MGGGTAIIIPFGQTSCWTKCKGSRHLGSPKRGQTHSSQFLEQCFDHKILVALEHGVSVLSFGMCENFSKNTEEKELINRNHDCTLLIKECICVIMCGQNA